MVDMITLNARQGRHSQHSQHTGDLQEHDAFGEDPGVASSWRRVDSDQGPYYYNVYTQVNS